MNTTGTSAVSPEWGRQKHHLMKKSFSESYGLKTELERLSIENKRLVKAYASVAHDLKNHLQIMLMAMERTGKIQAEPEYRNIYGHTLAMKETVSHIMEHYQDNYSNETCSVMNVILEVINLLGEQAKFIVLTGLDTAIVKMPAATFKKIVFNLAHNSIKHCKKDEPVIMIDISGNSKNLRIRFQDNGAGIPSDVAEKFEHTTPAFNPGLESGSGLWFVRESVHEHHGTIRIKEGSVIITLPAP
jgi:signal transduction histidine kinase